MSTAATATSPQLPAHAEHDHVPGHHCPVCGPTHGLGRHERLRLFTAILGGILVLNSYLGKRFFAANVDEFAIELSAIAGALILGVPVFLTAVRDLLKGRVYMNELVALALVAAFANHDYRTAGAVAFFMLITITIERKTAIGAEASI